MSIYLGIDAGGTKTSFGLVDDDGGLLGEVRLPGAYYLDSGLDGVAEVLRAGLSRVYAAAGVRADDVDYAYVGLPAYGEALDDVPALDALPRRALGHDRYKVVNDAVCGWAGSLGGLDGVNVVSGTGSIAYGQWSGIEARCGGWGELFGDEGSGYWVAVQGLGTFSRMSDGRLPAGPLVPMLREHLGLRSDLDLLGVVLRQWGSDRSRIAALSRVVCDAAAEGDAACAAVLAKAGAALADLVRATAATAGAGPGAVVPVTASGGMAGVGAVRSALLSGLGEPTGRADTVRFELRPSLLPPHFGAVILAARATRRPLSPAAFAALQRATGAGPVA